MLRIQVFWVLSWLVGLLMPKLSKERTAFIVKSRKALEKRSFETSGINKFVLSVTTQKILILKDSAPCSYMRNIPVEEGCDTDIGRWHIVVLVLSGSE
jgi:hypothetical protein